MKIAYTQTDHEQALKACSEFVNMEQTFDTLWKSANLNSVFPMRHNVVAWGPGGYGKSEAISSYLYELTAIEPKVISLHEQIGVTEAHGGIDLQEWIKNNRFTINFDNSWMNHEIVIFEEGLSVPKEVLAALRQTITSRIYSLGQTRNVKTWMIVIATNEDITEIARYSQSMEAFSQRFPIRIKVDWSHLTPASRISSFIGLAKRHLQDLTNDEREKISRLIGECCEYCDFSPRQCIQLAQNANMTKEMYGNIISRFKDTLIEMGIDPTSLPDYEQLRKNELLIAANNEINIEIDRINQAVTDLTKKLATSQTTIDELKAGSAYLNIMQKNLTTVLAKHENAGIGIKTDQFVYQFGQIEKLQESLMLVAGRRALGG